MGEVSTDRVCFKCGYPEKVILISRCTVLFMCHFNDRFIKLNYIPGLVGRDYIISLLARRPCLSWPIYS